MSRSTGTAARACRGKRRHETHGAADRCGCRMVAQGFAADGSMRAYRCRYCGGGWHVGHRLPDDWRRSS